AVDGGDVVDVATNELDARLEIGGAVPCQHAHLLLLLEEQVDHVPAQVAGPSRHERRHETEPSTSVEVSCPRGAPGRPLPPVRPQPRIAEDDGLYLGLTNLSAVAIGVEGGGWEPVPASRGSGRFDALPDWCRLSRDEAHELEAPLETFEARLEMFH